MENILCPACKSPNTFFSKKRQTYVCEECEHEFMLETAKTTTETHTKALRLFLSYGHDSNEALVRKIKADLEKRGHDVWFDKNEIKSGDDWRRSITDGIMGSNRVLSFLSKHSTRDPGVCLDEVSIAVGVKGGNIQTILVESELEVSAPSTLSHIQWLDMHDWKTKQAANAETWESWYQEKLAEIVRVVESPENIRFAGEIKKLNDLLKPISSEARIFKLLNKQFVGRIWLTEAVEKWRAADQSSRVFWITGDPGVGKSAFAANLAHRVKHKIIAVQFCEYDQPNHRNPKQIVRTLAFQLATRLPDYRKLLLELPEINDLGEKTEAELFSYLLANPLRTVIDGGRERCLILIDALDEAGEGGENPLVDMLVRNVETLPNWIGLVVTSRPETSVTTSMALFNPVIFDTGSEANRADIEEYLRLRLAQKIADRTDADTILEHIIAQSGCLFLYAEWVCEEIHKNNLSLDRLDQFPKGLGGIFAQFFKRQFPDQSVYEKTIEPILGAVLAAQVPIPVDLLQSLFNWKETELRKWLRTLGSLFPVSTENGVEVVKPWHKSIFDWLKDKSNDGAGKFFVSVQEGHKRLAELGWKEYQAGPATMDSYSLAWLPRHLIAMQEWRKIENVLCDIFFVEARAKAGLLDMLQQDYEEALKAMPEGEDRKCVDDFYYLFMRQKHNLAGHPDVVFSQLYNELQWKKGRLKDRAEKTREVFLKEGGRFLHQYRIPEIVMSQLIMTLTGRSGSVASCAFSPDGKRIVSGSWDNTLKLWDAETGKEITTLTGHSHFVTSCAFSPDGKRIVSGSEDKTLKLWDAETGKEITTLTGHSEWVTSCAFSPDGKRIVSGSNDNTLKLWGAETGKEITTLIRHSGDVYSCAFSPDGKRIVSGSWDETLKLWDAETGKEITTLTGHSSGVATCAFSPDGKRIVSGSNDRTLKLWDAETGKEITTLTGHSNRVTTCAFSPDGKRIVSGSYDTTLILWDAETGKEITTLTGHSNWVTSCAFSPDGKRIVSGSHDNTLKLWDAETGKEITTLTGHSNWVYSCAFSPDGKRIVSGSYDRTLKLWDAETGKEITTLTGHSSGVATCAFSPDGKRIVSGSWDNTLKLWDAETGKEITTLTGHSNWVTSCAYSPDGLRIVSGSDDNTLKIWDAKTGKELTTLTGHSRDVTSCAYSPDGSRIVSGSKDNTLKIWVAKTGREITTLTGHSHYVKSCAYSPDGTRIVSGSLDHTLKIWDAKTGKEITTLAGHSASVRSCAYSPDGTRIVSGSWDRTLKLWDAETGKEITTFYAEGSIECCTFSSDGSSIACGDGCGSLYFFKLEGFDIGTPIVTGARLWLFGEPGSTGALYPDITTDCPFCGTHFPLSTPLLDIISSLNRNANIGPDDSPCLKLPPEAWDDPHLLNECPKCKKPLRFNPFVVDNNPKQTGDRSAPKQVIKQDHPSEKESWFTITKHPEAGYGLELKCNNCEYENSYDPRDGDRPEPECPKCGFVVDNKKVPHNTDSLEKSGYICDSDSKKRLTGVTIPPNTRLSL